MDGTDEGYAGGGGSAAVVRGWGRKIGIFYWNGSEGRNKKGFCTECRENLQVGNYEPVRIVAANGKPDILILILNLFLSFSLSLI